MADRGCLHPASLRTEQRVYLSGCVFTYLKVRRNRREEKDSIDSVVVLVYRHDFTALTQPEVQQSEGKLLHGPEATEALSRMYMSSVP